MPKIRYKATKKRMDLIVNSLSKLSGRVASAEAAGITYATFVDWMYNVPGFKERVEEAEMETLERGKAVAIQAIFKAMDKNWAAGAWWLERNYPEQFAKRERLDMELTQKKIEFQIGITDPTLIIKEIKQIEDEQKLLQNKNIENNLDNLENEN